MLDISFLISFITFCLSCSISLFAFSFISRASFFAVFTISSDFCSALIVACFMIS
nr:hypothetical protein [Clostridioides difficile]